MKTRKLLSAVLCAALLAPIFPASMTVAGEETTEDFSFEEVSGDITFTEYNDKENEQYKIVGKNRRGAHTDAAVPYENEEKALNSALNYAKETSGRVKMLTGDEAANTWDFTVVKNLKAAKASELIGDDEGKVNTFAESDYSYSTVSEANAGEWLADVQVPSSWTGYGDCAWAKNYNAVDSTGTVFQDKNYTGEEVWVWDYPIYDNVKMPWQSGEQPYYLSDDEYMQTYGSVEIGAAPTEYNPIGFYRTTINTDGLVKNDNDRICISFQGVESAYYVFVDGNAVGYSEDSFRPHEFDITDYVEDGKNHILAVRVHKFSDSTWLEDQDMIYDGGIFRDVYLISYPSVCIEDYKVETDFDDSYTDADLIIKNLTLRNNTASDVPAGYTVTAKLYDKDNSEIAKIEFVSEESIPANETITLEEKSVNITSPKQWSAENPNIYVMSLTLADQSGNAAESTAQLVGFREIEFTPHSEDYSSNDSYDRITINGQPLLLKGVNRNDSTNPFDGKYISKELYDIDLKTMKQFNINTIRTSHYSNDEYMYYLADMYGFYIMAETNAECHEVAQRDRGNSQVYNEILGNIFKDRTISSYQSLKNHSSIIAWSIGNECGGLSDANSTIYYWMADYFHENDATRPVHSEFVQNRECFDMESNMYPTVEKVQSMASTPEAAGSANASKKPYFLCEYVHAMGNAVGDISGYWDAIRSGTNMLGGCIWDWVDQSRAVPISRVTNSDDNTVKRTDANKNIVPNPYDYYADGKYLANESIFGKMRSGYFFGYGGDWGDVNYEGRNVSPDGSASGSGSGQFAADGLLSPDRQPQPEIYEVKYQYQSFWMKETTIYEQQKIKEASGADAAWTTEEDLKNQQIAVYNENNFTNLNEYNVNWILKQNGESIAEGTIDNVSSVAPKTSGLITVPFGEKIPDEIPAGAEYQLYVEVVTKEDSWGLNAGHEVAHEQFELSEDVLSAAKNTSVAIPEPTAAETGGDGVSVSEDDDKFSVVGDNFSFNISKKTGFLTDYVYNGETLIKQLKPNYTRANHDNDSPMIDNWKFADEEKNITPIPNAIQVSEGSDGRKVIDVGVKIKVSYDGDEYAKEILRYTIDKSGAVTYRMYLDTTEMPNQTEGGRFILRLGSEIRMDKAYEDIKWYGNGMKTGGEYGYSYPVTEGYRDRDTYAVKGVYSSAATDMYFPYIKTQESGTVNGVTWAVMENADSDTVLLVTANKDYKGKETDPNYTDNSLEVSALHYSTKDLRNGSLHPYEITSTSTYTTDTDSTYFNVDHKSLGIGNTSCGPKARDDARINTGYIFDYEYTFMPAQKTDTAQYSEISVSWKAAADTDAKLPSFSKDLGSIGAVTPDMGLPETVTVDGTEQSVVWDNTINDCPVYEDTEITGTLADGTIAAGTISVYPDNMYYFVDCGDAESSVFDTVKSLSSVLKNSVWDQNGVSDGWGMTTSSDDYGNPDGKETDGDKYKTGYWLKSGKTLAYSFELEAGKYTVTEGAYEFWNGNSARNMKVTASASNGTELDSGTMTLDSKNGTDKTSTSLSFELETADTVTVELSKESGADPVISWIGIAQSLPYEIEAQDGIEPSAKSAYAGETITLTGNYASGSLFVNDADGTQVDLTENTDGTYSFVMPKSDVSVTGLVNTDSTVYVVPSKIERVTTGSDKRNYYIKYNCALGMTFDIPSASITSAKLHFIRQNTAASRTTNVYHQDTFAYEDQEGYIAQYDGTSQTGLELSEIPTSGEYKLLLAYDQSVSQSAAGNDYFVIDPVDNNGNASELQRPKEVSQLPYLELAVDAASSPTPTVESTPTASPETSENVWDTFEDEFTGETSDYGIVWYKYSGDSDNGTYSVAEDDSLTITVGNENSKTPCYGVSAVIKNIQPNTKYTISFKEKTSITDITNTGHGFYLNTDTLLMTQSNTNPNTIGVAQTRNNKKLATLHNAVSEDADWEEHEYTWVSGNGLKDGYDTYAAKFTFIMRSCTGSAQIKDLVITGAAAPEPTATPSPIPAPTKDPDKDYTPEVHTGEAIDRLNTDDTFQYHFAGGTDEYMETGEDTRTADNGKKYDAYMWVPKTASPDTLRGLVAIKVNLIEVPLAYSKVLKAALTEKNFGILFIVDKNDNIPSDYTGEGKNYKNILQGMYTETDYKGDELFTAQKWHTYDGKDAADIMNDIMNGIADASGYECVRNNTPVITIGHSAASPFGYRSGNWAYERVIAQIDMKNGMWGDSTDSSTADDDAHGFGMVPGIPSLQYAAQYTEHALGAGRDRSVCDARYHIEHQRAVDHNQLVSHIIEWGSGHYDWSNNASEMITKYIIKAIEYRLPDSFGGGSEEYVLNDLTDSGYLMKPFEKDNGSERPAGYYAENGWLSSGTENASASDADKEESFWYFDEELANEINEFTSYAIPESPGRNDTGVEGKTHTDKEPYMLMKDPSKSAWADTKYDFNSYISPFASFNGTMSRYGDNRFVNYERMENSSAGNGDSNPQSGATNTSELRGYDTLTVDTYYMSTVPSVTVNGTQAYDGTGDAANVPENTKAEVVPLIAPYELIDSELIDTEGMVSDGTELAENVAAVTRSTLRFHNNRVYYDTGCKYTNGTGTALGSFSMIYSPEVRDENGNVTSVFKSTGTGMNVPYVNTGKGTDQTLTIEPIDDVCADCDPITVSYTSSDADLQKYTDVFVNYGPAKAVRTVNRDDGSYSWTLEILEDEIPDNAVYPIEVSVVASNLGKWEKVSGAAAETTFLINSAQPSIGGTVENGVLTSVYAKNIDTQAVMYAAQYDENGALTDVDTVEFDASGEKSVNIPVLEDVVLMLWDKEQKPLCSAVTVR